MVHQQSSLAASTKPSRATLLAGTATIALLALPGTDASADVTFTNFGTATSVFASGTLYPWSVESDNADRQTAYFSSSPFNDSVSADVSATLECLDENGLWQATPAHARSSASHSSSFDGNVLIAAGQVSTDVSNYFSFGEPACGTGQAQANAQGHYALSIDRDYQLTVTGQLDGVGRIWLADVTTQPEVVLFEKTTPGPFSFTTALSSGVSGGFYRLWAQAGLGQHVSGVAQPHPPNESGQASFSVNVAFSDSPEICDNGVDDDADGLVDEADPDCDRPQERVGLQVRCMHAPLYPQDGDTVTVTAKTIGDDGEPQPARFINLYVGDLTATAKTVEDAAEAVFSFTADTGSFSYGCQAVRGDEEASSWSRLEPLLRTVDVGTPDRPALKAIPIMLNGLRKNRIDIVFFPDDDEYESYTDPAFQADVARLIEEGYFTIPWFVEFQWLFNFWIATDDRGNASPNPDDSNRCFRELPDDHARNYPWVDAAAIVHTSSCRDNAGSDPDSFTIEMQATRLQVVAHETGHRPFGLADEYCCDGGYYTRSRFPNLFEDEQACRDAAVLGAHDADDCRSFTSSRADGTTWWIGEPDYGTGIAKEDEIADLMQQTGGVRDADGNLLDRYQIGNSERDRVTSFWVDCHDGGC